MRYPPTEKYDERGFAPPVTPGDYLIVVSEVTDVDKDGAPLIDKNGLSYLRFEFGVNGYPDNKLFDRFSFDESNPHANIAMGRFKQLLIACGMATDVEGDTSDLVGKTCKATVTTREHEGKVYNNVVEYKPAEDGEKFKDDDLPF